jgi:hypothetical protein
MMHQGVCIVRYKRLSSDLPRIATDNQEGLAALRAGLIDAMRGTIGVGYPEIKAFTLTEVDKETDGFQVVGCARLQREEWKATTIQYINVKLVNGKALFGWPDGSGEKCKV